VRELKECIERNQGVKMHKCPRQENRDWSPEEEFEVECPGCGQSMEFFKDEEKRKCRKCGQMVKNPQHQDVE
jgi:ribosomal protein S27E